jgi:hypothetical protein
LQTEIQEALDCMRDIDVFASELVDRRCYGSSVSVLCVQEEEGKRLITVGQSKL